MRESICVREQLLKSRDQLHHTHAHSLSHTHSHTFSQGVTLKMMSHKLIIARILYGGLIYRQGLLQVGDRIVDVNGESVDSMNPSELQDMLVCTLTTMWCGLEDVN